MHLQNKIVFQNMNFYWLYYIKFKFQDHRNLLILKEKENIIENGFLQKECKKNMYMVSKILLKIKLKKRKKKSSQPW